MFIDSYLPEKIRGYPFVSTPRWSTAITQAFNGDERRNQNWVHPLHRFSAPEVVTCQEQIEDIRDAWLALAGPAHSFAFRDPMDFASRRLAQADRVPSLLLPPDQYLGVRDGQVYARAVGDGLQTEFQLMKEYTFANVTYRRPIYLPQVGTILLGLNGSPVDPGDYFTEIDRIGGKVRFDPAPQLGAVLTWGGLFDVECRFEGDDAFDAIVRSYGVAGAADLSFVELRPC